MRPNTTLLCNKDLFYLIQKTASTYNVYTIKNPITLYSKKKKKNFLFNILLINIYFSLLYFAHSENLIKSGLRYRH